MGKDLTCQPKQLKKETLIIFTSWFECSIHNELQSLQLGNSRLQLKATLSAIRQSQCHETNSFFNSDLHQSTETSELYN